MRKLLISILIALLLLITIYSVVKGLSIGKIKILGFQDIRIESEKLDKEIRDITTLKEQTYKKTLSDIESNAKTLLKEKEEYATLVSTSTSSEIEKATHKQKYEQDFLWAKIGNHATAQGVELKFDIAIGAINPENYDLHFTVTGYYTNITEFVLALENDNLLGFRIENFKLVPEGDKSSTKPDTNKTANTNTNSTTNNTTATETVTLQDSEKDDEGKLQATFKVTDIGINIDKSKINTTTTNDEEQMPDNVMTQEATNTTGTNTTTANTTTTEGTTAE